VSLRAKPQIKFSEKEHAIIQKEIVSLLDKQVIEQVDHCSDEVISNIFTREKRDSKKHRVILNLSELNEYIEYTHFKMDTLATALDLVGQNYYCASIDLSDAYYSVSIHPDDRKFLRFEYAGNLYQFTCLPNGLTSGPRAFTKLLKPPLATLRRHFGITIMGYLDDLFLTGNSIEQVAENVKIAVRLFTDLGFKISGKKSQFVPVQRIQFLRFDIDTVTMHVHMLDQKADRLIEHCRNLITHPRFTIRELAQVLGFMTASMPANPHARLFSKQLEKWKIQSLKENHGNFEAHIKLPDNLISDLDWWISQIHGMSKPIQMSKPKIVLYTDASKAGWGCHVSETKESTSGRWSLQEQNFHINTLELLAVFYSLQALFSNVENSHVRIMTDNTVTMMSINKQGSTASESCDNVARQIWLWALKRNIWLSAVYCPGKLNVEADLASRKFNDDTEWSLDQKIFQDICTHFGTPSVDVFASRLNAKCNRYFSWRPDPNAEFIGAFGTNWTFEFIYAFPPFGLRGPVGRKVREEGGGVSLWHPSGATRHGLCPYWSYWQHRRW